MISTAKIAKVFDMSNTFCEKSFDAENDFACFSFSASNDFYCFSLKNGGRVGRQWMVIWVAPKPYSRKLASWAVQRG